MASHVFATTHWSVVLSAKDAGNREAGNALEVLCRTYWPPLYAWLRRQGYSVADAEDLVQGFFEGFLSREALRDVGQDKGRFRSFLLASLRNHLLTARRNQQTQKRGGGAVLLRWDEPGVAERCEAAVGSATDADEVFDRVWAETVLERSVRAVRAEYESSGRGTFFEGVRAWLVREARPGEYAAAAETLGLTEGALAVAVHRLRARFRARVREEVAHTVTGPEDIDDEMRYLSRVLSRC